MLVMNGLDNELLSGSSAEDATLSHLSGNVFNDTHSLMKSPIEYGGGVVKELEEQKMKNATLRRKLAEERNARNKLQRELEEMKKYMFADTTSMLIGDDDKALSIFPASFSSPVSLTVHTPSTGGPSDTKALPLVSVPYIPSDQEIIENLVSTSMDLLNDNDPLHLDEDILSDIDALVVKHPTTPNKNEDLNQQSEIAGANNANANVISNSLATGKMLLSSQTSMTSPESPSSDIGNTVTPGGTESEKKRANSALLDIEELEVLIAYIVIVVKIVLLRNLSILSFSFSNG